MNRYAITPLAEDPVVLKLDDCGYRANKDELAKLVMELVSRDKREHPFKDDGPHRHWFQVVAPRRIVVEGLGAMAEDLQKYSGTLREIFADLQAEYPWVTVMYR